MNQGIDTVSEVAHFVRSNSQSIRRWLNRQNRQSIISPDYQAIDGQFALSSLDMIEALAIVELRKMGISLQTI